MKNELKSKTVLVYDSGQFHSFAQCLAKDFKKVYYHKSWVMDGFPSPKDFFVGYGYKEIEVIDDIWKVIDEADLVIFTDLYNAGLQQHLIEYGKLVFGAGEQGEQLEVDRGKFRNTLKKLNLPRANAVAIQGVCKLEDHLKKVKNKYIKISKFRKLHETFHHISWEHSASIISEIKSQCGALEDQIEFIVEDEIESVVEIGYDGWVVDGISPKKAIFGIEIKDAAYICKTLDFDQLPKIVKDINKKCAPLLKNYRMFYSNEIRVDKQGIGYLTDITSRNPSPPSELYQVLFKNLGEICYYGAMGECIEPEYANRFGGEIIINSDLLSQGIEQPISFPKEIEPFVKLRYSYKVGDMYYCIPQQGNMPEVGSIVATGGSVEEVVDKLCKYADKIVGHDLIIKTNKLYDCEEDLEKLTKYGVDFYD